VRRRDGGGPERGGGGPGGALTTQSGEGATGGSKLRPPGLLELEELLSAHLETRVKVQLGGGRGRMVVEFADLADLERIYRVMTGRPETQA
jgi:ParB family transcriptional regulator, chromosome partitioning protein